VLLNYFGDQIEGGCGNCDLCLDPPETFDATEDARKALSCVYRVGQAFGIRHVIDVLRGADNERIRRLGHDRLSTYAIGGDKSEIEWSSLIRQLIHHGYLLQDIEHYSVLRLTPEARPVLRGEKPLRLALPRIREKTQRKAKTPKGVAEIGPYDEALFERLRALRKSLADAAGVPPYVVFGDNSLLLMARDKPTEADQFLAISGVGQAKLERYGDDFMNTIAEHEIRSAEGGVA
jgi:ATP-dependent DNA helicase RecQ